MKVCSSAGKYSKGTVDAETAYVKKSGMTSVAGEEAQE